MEKRTTMKRLLCVLLILGFIATDFAGIGRSAAVKAAAKKQAKATSEAALRKKLAKSKKQYPKGAFNLLESRISLNEGMDEKKKITIVREGGIDTKASVTLKVVDVTTTYDKDYRLYVDGKKIEAPEGTTSMLNVFADAVTANYKKKGKASGEKKVASGSAAEIDDGFKITAKEKAPKKKKVKNDGLSPLQRGIKAQTGEVETQKDWRELTDTDPDYSKADKLMKDGESDIQKIAEAVDGANHTFVFEKGEYKKEVEIELLDDETSEGDEQAAIMLINADGSVLGESYHGYINISDDEKEVKANYSFKDSFYTAPAGADYVTVTVVKDGAKSRMTVTDMTAIDGTAKNGVNYVFETQPIVFIPGETEKTVKIPVLNKSTKKDVAFTIGVNSGDGETDLSDGIATVTITKAKKKASKKSSAKQTKKKPEIQNEVLEAKFNSPRFGGGAVKTIDKTSDANNVILKYDPVNTPESVVCHEPVIEYLNSDENPGHDGEYDRWTDIPLSADGNNTGEEIDFTNAEKVEIEYSSQWCEGQYTDKDVPVLSWFGDFTYDGKMNPARAVGFCVFDDNDNRQDNFYFKNESEGKISKSTAVIVMNGRMKGKGKIKYFVRGNVDKSNRLTGASVEIYRVRVYYKKQNISVKMFSYNGSNSYIERVYDSDKNSKAGAVFTELGQISVDGTAGGSAELAYPGESVKLTPTFNAASEEKTSTGVMPADYNTELLGFMVIGKSGNPVKPLDLSLENRVDIPASESDEYSIGDFLDFYEENSQTYTDSTGKSVDNCLVLAPVFRPKKVKYVFKSSDGSGLYKGYAMNKSADDALEVTALDTVCVDAAPAKKGIAVGEYTAIDDKGVALNVISEKSGEGLTGKVDISPANGQWQRYYNWIEEIKLPGYNFSMGIGRGLFDDALAATIKHSEKRGTPVITVETIKGKIKVRVMARPGSDDSYKDMMTVMYVDPSGDEVGIADQKTDYSFTVSDSLALGKEYPFTSIANPKLAGDQHYTILWQDATCDTNEDGILSDSELKAMYGTNKISDIDDVKKHKGDTWMYRVNKQDAKIYYEVRKTDPTSSDKIAGAVSVKDTELFTGYATEKYVNGASVVLGKNTSKTKTLDKKNAYYKGGDGYYEFGGDGTLEPDGTYSIAVNYDGEEGASMHGYIYAQTKAFTKIELLTDAVMYAKSSKIEKAKDVNNLLADESFESMNYQDVDNGDTNYKLSFNFASRDSSRIPKKAYLKFVRKDGTTISVAGKTIKTADGKSFTVADGESRIPMDIALDGSVSFIFNPSELELTPGTGIKVQVEDQLGIKYPERTTGIKLRQAIQPFVLMSSFICGGDSTIVEMIGAVVSVLDLGGELSFTDDSHLTSDTKSGERKITSEEFRYYKEMEANLNKKREAKDKLDFRLSEDTKMSFVTITLGWGKDDVVDETFFKKKTAAQKKAEADEEYAKARMTNQIIEDLRAAGQPIPTDKKSKKPKYSEVSEADLREKKDAVDQADEDFDTEIKDKLLGKKEKKKISANLKIGLKFSFSLTFYRDLNPELNGALYFDSFMLVAQADGKYSLSSEFMLPLGITVTIGFSVGADLGATFIIDNPLVYGHRYYMEKVEGGEDMTALGTDGEYMNLFKMIENKNNDFKKSGVFDVAPFVSIDADGKWGGDIIGIEAKVKGQAKFNMKFFTGYRSNKNSNYGTVTLSAEVTARVSVLEHTWKWETKPLSLFGEAPLSAEGFDTREAMDDDASTLKPTDFKYMDTRPGWQGGGDTAIDENGLSISATATTDPGIALKTLQQKVYAGTRVDMKSIGGGNYLAVFIDADASRKLDVNKTAAYYTIYTGSTGKWSTPKQLDNDKTADEDVKLVDLGDRGMVAIWVDATKEFTNKSLRTEILQHKDLSGRFFDKSTKSFGSVMAFTKETKESPNGNIYGNDSAADIKPNIVYSKAKNTMLLYYTKSQYEYDEKSGEKIGDVVVPTLSKMAYREYRFSGDTGTAGEWITDYEKLTDKTVAEGMKDEGKDDFELLSKQWYGQVWFDAIADVYIDETLNNEGYWADEMMSGGKLSESRIFASHKVTGGATKDALKNSDKIGSVVTENTKVEGSTTEATVTPRIIDTDAIHYTSSTGKDMGIFAYTVDYDDDFGTTKDRDIYIQYFDFDTGVMVHPIIITSDSVTDGNVRFVQTDKAAYLAWLHDGDLVMFGLKNLEDHLIKRTNGDNSFYILDKSAPKVNANMSDKQIKEAYEKAYTPPIMLADGHRHMKETVILPGEPGYPSDKTDGLPYIKDSKKETEGCISDFDVASKDDTTYFTWTETVSKTKDGIDENSAAASKPENRLVESQLYMIKMVSPDDGKPGDKTAPVQVTNYKGANFSKVASAVTDKGNVKLIAVKTGTSVTKIKKTKVAGVSDKNDMVAMDVVPDTKPEIDVEDDILDHVRAGEQAGFTFNVHNNGLKESGKVTVSAVGADGKSILETKPDLGKLYGGEEREVKCVFTPDKNAKSASVTITIKDESGKVLDKKTIKKKFSEAIVISDLSVSTTDKRDEFIVTFKAANDGERKSDKHKASIGIVKGKKKSKLDTVSIGAMDVGKGSMYAIRVKTNSAKWFEAKADSDGDVSEFGTFYITGEKQTLDTVVTREATKAQVDAVKKLSSKLAGGTIANIKSGQKYYGLGLVSTDKKADKEAKISGVKTVYVSDDPTVADVSADGVVTGHKKGTAEIKVIAMPADTDSQVTSSKAKSDKFGGEFAEKTDGYPKMPNAAIKTYSVVVNVDGGSNYKTIGGVTYKKSGKKAVVVKAKKTLTKATIAAKVSIKGKKIKVTKINPGVFKNCKKLKKVVFKSASVPTIGKKAFTGIYKKAVFDVPNKSKKKYKNKLNKKTGFKKTMKIK